MVLLYQTAPHPTTRICICARSTNLSLGRTLAPHPGPPSPCPAKPGHCDACSSSCPPLHLWLRFNCGRRKTSVCLSSTTHSRSLHPSPVPAPAPEVPDRSGSIACVLFVRSITCNFVRYPIISLHKRHYSTSDIAMSREIVDFFSRPAARTHLSRAYAFADIFDHPV